jgi:hypothetical protein
MKKHLKRILFGSGNRDARIRFGAARGIRMSLDTEHRIQRLLGLEEREIHGAFKEFAKGSEIFADIGASDGYYGLVYYKWHPEGRIFLFDSDYKFPPLQRNNFLLNHFPIERVSIVSKYVCDFSDNEHIALGSLLAGEKGDIFLKIDVDGGELEVLKGVKKVLESRKCKLIIETHSMELEDDCMAFLKGLDYRIVIIPNAWWRVFIPEKRPIAHNRWLRAESP